jgi:hypothetical protein
MGANDIQHGGNHYKKGGALQHWDIVAKYGVGYLEGCATKYPTRHLDKNGVEDIKKAMHYVDKIIEMHRTERYRPRGIVPEFVVENFCDANSLGDDEREIMFCLFRWDTEEHLFRAKAALERILANTYGVS